MTRLRIPDSDHPKRGQAQRRLRRRTVAVLPTLFTLSNLLCGFLAIFFASRPVTANLPWQWTPLTLAAMFIFFGMVFDALDGRVARLTGQSSTLGEQLDSMADMVTFGTAPAFLAIQLVGQSIDEFTPFLGTAEADTHFGRIVLVISAIYVACAALRLARFNIEKSNFQFNNQSSFKGMPSPAAAGTVASFILLHQHFLAKRVVAHWTISAAAVGMVAIMLLVAVAMVSRQRYPHVANRYFRGSAPFNVITKVVLIAPFLVVWPQGSAALGFAIYAIFSPVASLWRRMACVSRPREVATSPQLATDTERSVGGSRGS